MTEAMFYICHIIAISIIILTGFLIADAFLLVVFSDFQHSIL